MKNHLFLALFASATCSAVLAEDPAKDLDIKTTGYFIVDGGYISETEDVGLKRWQNEPFADFIGGLRLSAQPTDRFRLTINPELKSHNIFPMSPGIATGETVQRQKYDIYLEEAKGSWSLGGNEHRSYSLDFGYMIYKDNPDAHAFGDYLFRSMIYPGILFTKFDYAQAQIFGAHGTADFLDGRFRNNAFFLSEVRNYPYFDFSLAYSGSYNVGGFLEFGAGINARSVIPVRPSRTTPKGGEGLGVQDNTYKFVPYQDSTLIHNAAGQAVKTVWVAPIAGTDSALVTIRDSAGSDEVIRVKASGNGVAGLSRGQLSNKAIGSLTPADGVGDLYPELHGTNTYYSFAGTIVTARMSFDPLSIVRKDGPFGKNAFKIYGEVGVLGWKNYPGFYEKRSERMPIMGGIYMPTFNRLDFLTFEMEKYTSKELPTYDKRSFLNVPQPGNHKEEVETLWDADRRKKDDLKWVISAKKSWRGWGLVGQVGTDHMKLLNDGGSELFDVMSSPSQWYAQIRFVGGVY
ncbi:MAG: hypothetical protein JWP91_1310 [Fibrobacteres bacterium]|nr:hypothetical protein [Fibrobacterota bacterium]